MKHNRTRNQEVNLDCVDTKSLFKRRVRLLCLMANEIQ
jgi:hypothetical protein